MYSIRKTVEQDMPFLLEIDRMSCEREHVEWIESQRDPLVRRFVEHREGFGFIAHDLEVPVGALMARLANTSEPHINQNELTLLEPKIGIPTEYVEIYDLWIDPLHRKKHIATSLKLAMEQECRDRLIEWIYTFQHPENSAAIRMNERLGYEHLGLSPMYDDVLRVCFLKRITIQKK